LDELVNNVEKAENALTKAGLSLRRKSDWEEIKKVLRPYEKKYFAMQMVKAYRRLNDYLGEHMEFLPYAQNLARMEKRGGNPFNPREWTEGKLEQARRLALREP
jgi:hypothetical protein